MESAFDTSIIEEKQRRLWTYDDTPVLLVLFITLYLFISYVIPSYFLMPVNILGPSMIPTLYQNDKVVLYMQGEIDYGNIVVLYAPDVYNEMTHQNGEDIIKRVMGKPGDTVWFEKEQDGKYVFYRESTVKGMTTTTVIKDEFYTNNDNNSYSNGNLDSKYRIGEKFTLKNDEYFVLGDNRSVSLDSRSDNVGPVKRAQIRGKALFLIREGKVYIYNKTFF